jgi:hypothetical protein
MLDATSGAISDSSGTLLAELMVANSGDVLKPGSYAEVTFDIPSSASSSAPQALLLPSSALLFRSQGMEVAVVDAGGHVHVEPVGTGRNLGQAMEITSGLQPNARVIDNPPDSIAEGQLVRVVAPVSSSGRGG